MHARHEVDAQGSGQRAVVTEAKTYSAGVPCWIETLQPDARGAVAFYTGLFAWDVVRPARMPFKGGEYFVARVDGDDVAGIATLPPGSGIGNAIWSTSIRVDDVHGP